MSDKTIEQRLQELENQAVLLVETIKTEQGEAKKYSDGSMICRYNRSTNNGCYLW